MMDVDEAVIAVRAAKENTSCEVICSYTFDRTDSGKYSTLTGATPAEAAQAAIAAGSDIIGTNCGNGISRMVDIVRELRMACPDKPILVQANAGLLDTVGGKLVYPETPEYMASFIPALAAAGANIIGGCCGTTPAHIAAIKRVVITAVKGCRA